MRREHPEDLDLPPDVAQALERFLAEATERFPDRIQRVVLFGSVARGEAREDSDVDLLVVWDGSEGEAIRSLVPITSEILVDTGVDLAIHPVSPNRLETLRAADTYFYRNLQQEGVSVAG